MKFWAVNIALGLILLTTIGCERQDPADDNSTAFDPDLDPAARMISVDTDPDIMEDQAKISRQASQSKSPRRTAAPTDAGDDAGDLDPIELVKAKVTAAIEGMKANDPEPLIEIFDDEAAQLLGPIMRGGLELDQKSLALLQLIETELGIEPSADVKSMLSGKSGGPSDGPASGLAVDSVDDLTFELDGDNVVVNTSQGKPMVFSPVDSDYKLSLPEEAKDPRAMQMFGLMNEILAAQMTLIDEVTTGIETGEITLDNFEPKVNEIADRTVKPAMAKLFGGMLSQMDQLDADAQPDETDAQPDLAPDEVPPGKKFTNPGLDRMVNPTGNEPLE